METNQCIPSPTAEQQSTEHGSYIHGTSRVTAERRLFSSRVPVDVTKVNGSLTFALLMENSCSEGKTGHCKVHLCVTAYHKGAAAAHLPCSPPLVFLPSRMRQLLLPSQRHVSCRAGDNTFLLYFVSILIH